MKITNKLLGVLADIHSNFEALKSTVDYLEKRVIEEFIFLGDYTGELPCPEKTLEFIHNLCAKKKVYLIKGNKEEYIEDALGDGHPEQNCFLL